MTSLITTIIIPFFIALALYMFATYILYPLYQRHKRYAAYIPLALPSPLPDGTTAGLFSRIRSAVIAPLERAKWFQQWQRPRAGPAEFEAFEGDEELEEGAFNGGRERRAGADETDGEVEGRRLSRDLEVGFRDDSDEEDEGQRERAVSGRRT